MRPEATGLTLWDGEVGGSKARGVELVARALSSAGAPQSLDTVTASESWWRAPGPFSGFPGPIPVASSADGGMGQLLFAEVCGVVCRLLLSVVLRPLDTLSLFSLWHLRVSFHAFLVGESSFM